jgi:hypothetical protein
LKRSRFAKPTGSHTDINQNKYSEASELLWRLLFLFRIIILSFGARISQFVLIMIINDKNHEV